MGEANVLTRIYMRRLPSVYTKPWYIYLLSCKPWQRYLLCGSLLSALCIGWFFAIYCTLESECCVYQQKLAAVQKQCHTCACAATEYVQKESTLNNLCTIVKPYQRMDVCPLIVSMECAAKAGLCVHSCIMGQTRNDGQHTELITIEASGSTRAFIKFFTLLTQLPYIITYEQMHGEYQTEQLHATVVLGFVTLCE